MENKEITVQMVVEDTLDQNKRSLEYQWKRVQEEYKRLETLMVKMAADDPTYLDGYTLDSWTEGHASQEVTKMGSLLGRHTTLLRVNYELNRREK